MISETFCRTGGGASGGFRSCQLVQVTARDVRRSRAVCRRVTTSRQPIAKVQTCRRYYKEGAVTSARPKLNDYFLSWAQLI